MPERRTEIFDTTSFLDEDELSPQRAEEIVAKTGNHEYPFRFKDEILRMRHLVLRAITACRINGRPFQPESLGQHDAYWKRNLPLNFPNFDARTIPSAPVPLSINRANEIATAFESIDSTDSENTIKTLPFRAEDSDLAILDLIRQAYLTKLQAERKAPIFTADEEAEIYGKWNRLCGNADSNQGFIKNPLTPTAEMQIDVGYELMAVLHDQPDTLRHTNISLCFASTIPPLVIRGRDILKHLYFQMEFFKTVLMFHKALRERVEEFIDRLNLNPRSQLQYLEKDPSGLVDNKVMACLAQVVTDSEDTWKIIYMLLSDNSVVKQYHHLGSGDVFSVVLRPDGTLELPKLEEGENFTLVSSDPDDEEGDLDDGYGDSGIEGFLDLSGGRLPGGGRAADAGGGAGNFDELSLDDIPPDPDKDPIN